MSLRFGLVLMLWLVTAAAGLATLLWAAVDAHAAAERDAQTTLARAGEILERNYQLAPWANGTYAQSTSIKLLAVMAPGTCLEFAQADISARRLCAGWQVFGEMPPLWFRQLDRLIFPLPQMQERSGIASRDSPFSVAVRFDPVAATTLAWLRVRLTLAQTVAMALGVVALGTGAILWRLSPVGGIVHGLGRLAGGDLAARVEPGGASEFRRIGQALNRLAGRLEEGAERQRTLMRKLLEVEDGERRQLARDLHDEFGQTLAATNALATSIAIAAQDRPPVARDAEAVARNVRRMMEALRGAFARLRPPDLEEVGLGASLRTMLAGWEVGRATRITLDLALDERDLPASVALDLYRIVQECVTNAMRHAAPSQIAVMLRAESGGLRLVVEDDGGGDFPAARAGYGVLGIRERVAALGGALDLRSTGEGVHVEALVPLAARRDAA